MPDQTPPSTVASTGSIPCVWSTEMCPSPRCSRTSVAACHSASSSSSGHDRSACAAYSGRPCGVSAAQTSRAMASASETSGEPTSRSRAAATPDLRASTIFVGEVVSQAEGSAASTSHGAKT